MIFEKVKETMVNTLGCDEAKITESASIADDLGIDSLDAVELVMALEDEYNIEIPSEELTDLNTVGDVIEYMKSKGIDA